MALIHSKQLNPKFTGSFVFSGSNAVGVTGGINTDTITSTGDVTLQNNLSVSGTISNVSTTHVTASGNVDVGGDLNVSQYIYHKDDSNTYLNFTDDRLRFNIGGISYLDFNDSTAAPHDITFNDGGNNIDLTIKGNSNNPLFKTDASANRIGTHGLGSPKVDFHIGGDELRVDGNISGSSTGTGSFGTVETSGNISGSLSSIGSFGSVFTPSHVTASGNISGSATSTGSFGTIQLNDDTHLNSNGFSISGSSVSTASFGMVKIHQIAGNSPIAFADTIISNQNIELKGHLTASNNISASGDLFVTGNTDFDGNLDVDGVSNLDNTDIDGTLTVNGTNTTITSPIISMVGAVTASSHISASGNLNIGGNIETVGNITTQGDIIAKTFIVNSTVTNMTQSFSSGSTIFGDSNDDTHQVTGSLLNKGSITTTGTITATGNIITQGSINASQGQIFGSGIDDRHEFTGSVVVTGSLNTESGRIFEQGTSVIDHATAMAIVFGG